MNRLRILATLLLSTAALAPRVVSAQGDALPEARAVVQRFLDVTHAGAKLAESTSRYEKHAFSMQGVQGTTESWYSRPDRQRTVLDVGSFGKVQSGFSSGHAWMSSPATGAILLEGSELLQARLDAAYAAASKPAELYESLRTLGRAPFEGVECWKLELVAKPLPGMDPETTRAVRTTHEYYAIDSGYLLGSEGTADGMLTSGPISLVLSDYRDFGGVLQPGKHTVRQGGIEAELTLQSMTLNTVTDADLLPPPEVQKLIELAAKPAAAPPAPTPK